MISAAVTGLMGGAVLGTAQQVAAEVEGGPEGTPAGESAGGRQFGIRSPEDTSLSKAVSILAGAGMGAGLGMMAGKVGRPSAASVSDAGGGRIPADQVPRIPAAIVGGIRPQLPAPEPQKLLPAPIPPPIPSARFEPRAPEPVSYRPPVSLMEAPPAPTSAPSHRMPSPERFEPRAPEPMSYRAPHTLLEPESPTQPIAGLTPAEDRFVRQWDETSNPHGKKL